MSRKARDASRHHATAGRSSRQCGPRVSKRARRMHACAHSCLQVQQVVGGAAEGCHKLFQKLVVHECLAGSAANRAAARAPPFHDLHRSGQWGLGRWAVQAAEACGSRRHRHAHAAFPGSARKRDRVGEVRAVGGVQQGGAAPAQSQPAAAPTGRPPHSLVCCCPGARWRAHTSRACTGPLGALHTQPAPAPSAQPHLDQLLERVVLEEQLLGPQLSCSLTHVATGGPTQAAQQQHGHLSRGERGKGGEGRD